MMFVNKFIELFTAGNFAAATSFLFIFFIVLVITKPTLFEKLLTKLNIKRKTDILNSEAYQNFVRSSMYRTAHRTRQLQSEYDRAIRKIQDGILKKQMTFAENAVEQVSAEQLNLYRKELKRKILTMNFCNACEVKCQHCGNVSNAGMCRFGENIEETNMDLYKAVLHTIYDEILSESRRAFKENGLAEKSQAEWDDYIVYITGTALAKGEEVARAKIKEQHMILTYEEGLATVDKDKVFKQQTKVFEQARKIAIQAHDEIERLEKELADKLKEAIIEEELGLLIKTEVTSKN